MADDNDWLSGGGLLDWFTKPMDAPDPAAGLSRLGLLGAALQDVGAAQQGGQGSALADFAQRQRYAAQYPRTGGAVTAGSSATGNGLQRIGAPVPSQYDEGGRSLFQRWI